jgi:hypothetical protein
MLSKRELFRRWRHRRNLRCDHCGGGFRLDEDLFSYSSSPPERTWHEFCMAYRRHQGQVADLIAYVQGVADSNQVFRVEHMYLGIGAAS